MCEPSILLKESKADRPHPRDYTRKPPNYRHTDKYVGMKMTDGRTYATNPEGSAVELQYREV